MFLAQTALASPLDIFQNMPYNYGVRHCDKFTVFEKGKLSWIHIFLMLKSKSSQKNPYVKFHIKNLAKKKKNCLYEYDQTLD